MGLFRIRARAGGPVPAEERMAPEQSCQDGRHLMEIQNGTALHCTVDAGQIAAGHLSIGIPDGVLELAAHAFDDYNTGSDIIKAVTSLLSFPHIRANQLKKELIRTNKRFIPPEIRRLRTVQERCDYIMREEERSRLCRLSLPASLTRVHAGSFPVLLEGIDVDGENPSFCSIDGVLFSRDGKTLVRYPGLQEKRDYAIPEGTETIREGAFQNCFIGTLTIPGTITNLHSGIFSGSRYDTVRISEGVESIGPECFKDCRIRCLELPASLKTIGDGAFAGCAGITSLQCPDTRLSLGSRLFCNGTFEDIGWWCWSVIPKGAFLNCRLNHITVPAGVETIGAYAFAGCYTAKEITLPDSVREIRSGAFDEGPSYNLNIRLPEHLTRFLFRFPALSTINNKNRLPILQQLCTPGFVEEKHILEKQKHDLELARDKLNLLQQKQKKDIQAQVALIEGLLAGCGPSKPACEPES